jgi:methylglutaconyl-CoA hydratase
VTDLLRVERSGPSDVVARISLARPEVHNAFNASLIAELRSTFAGLARQGPSELRAVVLAGDGPSFCAGADIDWMRAAMALDVDGNEQDAMAMADMFETIDTCPVPVVARVQGAALGGGLGLGAVADVVIAEAGTKLGFTETRLGILPAVISPFVIAKIGPKQRTFRNHCTDPDAIADLTRRDREMSLQLKGHKLAELESQTITRADAIEIYSQQGIRRRCLRQ